MGKTYSGPRKSWPLFPCISYGSKGRNFCDPLYSVRKVKFGNIRYTPEPCSWDAYGLAPLRLRS